MCISVTNVRKRTFRERENESLKKERKMIVTLPDIFTVITS